MSIAISIQASDGISPVTRRVLRAIEPARLNPVIGRSANNTIREHLFGLNQTRPNQLGGRRTNFYTGAARATQFKVVSDSEIVVSINQVGIAQRYYGGTIKPKSAKYLTIPARAEAHGKRAREFPDLEVLRRGDGKGEPFALARKVNGKGGAKGGGEILFWLKKSITQRADPTVLPSNAVLGAAVQADVTAVVYRAIAGAGGPS